MNEKTKSFGEKEKDIVRKKAQHRKVKGLEKQGRIHGNPVADGWAGAVMRKPLANQKSDLPTD